MAGKQDSSPALSAAAEALGVAAGPRRAASAGSGAPSPVPGEPLGRQFFGRDPRAVAADLLGAVLVHDQVAVRLTEVEAYLGAGCDPASHAHRGRRPRNAVMFGPPGHAYVYFTYGMHFCANVVCAPDGVAGGVLLRAGAVVTGQEIARARRPTARREVDLARGPARLATALGLSGPDNGRDLCDRGGLELLAGDRPAPEQIRTGPRVGISAGEQSPWRFWLADEPTVSVYRPAARRRAKPVAEQP